MTNRIYSTAPWEKEFGYCRALKRGPMVFFTGTVDPMALNNTSVSAEDQTHNILNLLLDWLRTGFNLDTKDVVRTRIYITNADDAQSVGKVHGKFFKDYPPVTTMVVVKALIDPAFKVEIELEAMAEA